MHDTGSGDDQGCTRSARQIAGSLGSIGCGLFVTHSDVLNAGLLRGHRDWPDGKSDDPKHVVHALLLQAACDQSSAVDLAHDLPPSFICG